MKIAIAVCMLLVLTSVSHAKEWRGITPLKSTRADVERVLGQPSGSCNCVYDTGKEIVKVWYSGEPCADNIPYTYDVPRDTVWEIIVRPKANLRFADLRLDESKFRKAGDGRRGFVIYHINDEEGVIVEEAKCESRVISLIYNPAPANSVPGCSTGNHIYDAAPPQKFDEYSNLTLGAERERLDGLAQLLRETPWANSYIVSYSGGRGSAGDIRGRSERMRQYLITTGGIDATRIVTIVGGYRDKPLVEIYLWPDGWREYYGEVGEGNCKPPQTRRR